MRNTNVLRAVDEFEDLIVAPWSARAWNVRTFRQAVSQSPTRRLKLALTNSNWVRRLTTSVSILHNVRNFDSMNPHRSYGRGVLNTLLTTVILNGPFNRKKGI
jgi:hypothetical protein